MKIGFTGTQFGMTTKQKDSLLRVLTYTLKTNSISLQSFHHGDCIGADKQAHDIAHELSISIYIYPPTNDSKRAFCRNYIKLYVSKPYLERNRDIVNDCDLLIACPKSDKEELRSGTWSTIRYARSQNKEVIILSPEVLWHE